MFQRTTLAEAEKLADERLAALSRHGTEFSKIPPAAQSQATIGRGILEAHNRNTKLDLNLIAVFNVGYHQLEGGERKVLPRGASEPQYPLNNS